MKCPYCGEELKYEENHLNRWYVCKSCGIYSAEKIEKNEEK